MTQSQTLVSQPSPAELAKHLQQRVTMFHAGEELYSGAWLADFQKSGLTAWQICIDKLQMGPLKSCDEELLQAFCAQTLARLSRAFPSWFADVQSRGIARDCLESLLAVHANGQGLVWKQLALALACAELWLGTWAAAASLNSSLPATVRRELLVLPAELLFDAKALPLTDRNLRQGAAASLFRSCDAVFGFLLGESSDSQDLRILGAWLRAVRKAQLWLPTGDAAAPLRSLAQHLEPLREAARAAKSEGAEVAQQLAKWRGAPHEAAALLGPLCGSLFEGDSSMELEHQDSHRWLLPLLVDLAEDFWPRAAVGELDLDWELIARQAFALLGEAAKAWDGTHCVEEFDDVETTISVWQAFAETLHAAVRAADSFSSYEAGQVATFQPPPEKRSRRAHDRWQLPRQRLAEAGSIGTLFSLLLQTLLDCMRLPELPEDEEALGMLQRARQEVEAAMRPWAALLTNSETWIAELWEPLRRVEELLSGVNEEEGDFLSFEVARDIEVVIWFFGAFCSSLPDGQPSRVAAEAASRAISSIAPQLAHLDAALPPWRALLWSSACTLASAVNAKMPEGSEPLLLEWMLARPPSEAGAPTMLELTELPYARAIEAACRRLPSGSADPQIGEKLFMLAFASWNPSSSVEERHLEVPWVPIRCLGFSF
ncbi:unnamed protein product [Symbiodinium natans]|uniref:Uncharacterized protein n=1 Tax=Symbiodinium natans TaxID=878477 RepID=A0A812PC76_9DINO|nr:unnamed protein product [Symbiodinium natans]